MTASTSKTLRSICSISLSAAKLHFCINSATYGKIARASASGVDRLSRS